MHAPDVFGASREVALTEVPSPASRPVSPVPRTTLVSQVPRTTLDDDDVRTARRTVLRKGLRARVTKTRLVHMALPRNDGADGACSVWNLFPPRPVTDTPVTAGRRVTNAPRNDDMATTRTGTQTRRQRAVRGAECATRQSHQEERQAREISQKEFATSESRSGTERLTKEGGAQFGTHTRCPRLLGRHFQRRVRSHRDRPRGAARHSARRALTEHLLTAAGRCSRFAADVTPKVIFTAVSSVPRRRMTPLKRPQAPQAAIP